MRPLGCAVPLCGDEGCWSHRGAPVVGQQPPGAGADRNDPVGRRCLWSCWKAEAGRRGGTSS